MLSWVANFLANTATQTAGVTSMTGALTMATVAAILGVFSWHRRRLRDGKAGVEPSHLIMFGLIGALLSSGVALAGFVWQQYRSPSVISPPTGTSGEGPATAQPTLVLTWTENARLTITFDGELQNATPSVQDGVRYFYWYHFPGTGVDFEKRQVSAVVGYVMVFMALKDPTFTNYNRVRVAGGGVLCEVLSSHASGAVIRAMGDVRGRTLDIRFSKDPIPLD